MRRITAAIVATLILLAACGDDDDPSSPTATQSPTPTEGAVAPGQQTPNPEACTRDDVSGTLVSSEGAAGHTFLTLVASDAQRECTFDGPPELRWYDADGNGLGVPFTPAAACESDATEYDNCIYQDPVGLSPDPNPEPGATTGVTAIISVANIDVLLPCASPTRLSHFVGLQFPGVSLDVQIELPDDIEFQYCSAQVDLAGYGPVLTED